MVNFMRPLLFLSVVFLFSGSSSADIVCYKGDILHKGKVDTPGIEETSACRIHFEMMDASCAEDKVDVVASRSGSSGNTTLGCELTAADKMVECECATEKCNTPSLILKEAIAALNATTDEEKKILACFNTILESKFGLTTTTTTTTTTATTPQATTAAGGNNTTAKPDSSSAPWIIPTMAAAVLLGL